MQWRRATLDTTPRTFTRARAHPATGTHPLPQCLHRKNAYPQSDSATAEMLQDEEHEERKEQLALDSQPRGPEEKGEDELPAAAVPELPKEAPGHAAPRASKGPKRGKKPLLDLDDHIAKAKHAIQDARKQVQKARMQAKLEKRKKQRLLRKASNLNVEDLERIAVLKRCGLVGGSTTGTSERASASTSGASSSASGSGQQSCAE